MSTGALKNSSAASMPRIGGTLKPTMRRTMFAVC
jgi:hypothetical protein